MDNKTKILSDYINREVCAKLESVKFEIDMIFWDLLLVGNPSLGDMKHIQESINKVLEDKMKEYEINEWEVFKDEFLDKMKSAAPDKCGDCDELYFENEIFCNQEYQSACCDFYNDSCGESIKICNKGE